jgi:predicted HAD superfamily Cof-like phosphohydrolase
LVKETALRQQFAVRRRVESLDRVAQFNEVAANVAIAVHRFDRAVEEAVGQAGRLQHFLAPHVGDLVDLLAKGG